MPSTEALVPTDRASRYLVQLCRHLSEMGRAHGALARHAGGRMPEVRGVDWSEDAGVVRFPGGRCSLRAAPDALVVRLEADDDATLGRLQRGFTNRLQTIGRREGLRVEWRPVDGGGAAPALPRGGRSTRPPERGRGVLFAIGLPAAVLLVLGVHLAIGGALLSAPWTGLAGGALVATVALAAVVAVAHLGVGAAAVSGARLAHGRRRHIPPSSPGAEKGER